MKFTQRLYRRKEHRTMTPVLDGRTGQIAYGTSRDLSRGGIFVELDDPPPIGVIVDVFVGGLGGLQVLGRVVRVVPGQGFGAAFLSDTGLLEPLLKPSPAKS